MKKLLLLPLVMLMLAGFSTIGTAENPSGKVRKPCQYEQIGFADYPYRSFLKNWNDDAHPLFYALIRSAEEYDTFFAPAAVMGNKSPYAPDPELYRTYNLLVVARVTKPAQNGKSMFSIEKFVKHNDIIELYYKLGRPDRKATWTIKDGLVIKIEKAPIRKIVICENNRKVGELDIEHSVLSVEKPPMK
ncbi:MAG: hypothetical protein HGB36_06605 [Chlorobiaceae bacterium]|nr:hypothetical protein [Chlorobiaceae bacterium]